MPVDVAGVASLALERAVHARRAASLFHPCFTPGVVSRVFACACVDALSL